ncbi:MAG TPA: hypothetical protein VJ958_04945 [Atribacterota bacterium]|nr:hypothetical protein [Atribacterota bacterium]
MNRFSEASIGEIKSFIDATYDMSKKVAGQGEIAEKWVIVRIALEDLLESRMNAFINAL